MIRIHLAAALSLAGALAATTFAPPARAAADVLIDDFTTGLYRSPQLKSGWFVAAPEQSGTMLGGFRGTSLTICRTSVQGECQAVNPYNFASSYAITKSRSSAYPSALVGSAGAFVGPRIDVSYGGGPGGMSADLSGGPDRRLRFTFAGSSQPINFDVLLYTGTGYGQDGCNPTELNRPFVLELPLAEFTQAGTGFDPHAITSIDVILGSASAIGSVEFALQKIEVVDTALPGAIHCGPLQP